MQSEKTTLGRYEYVWLIATDQRRITARIDTGAQTTAIWASNIHEIDGELSWSFFGEGSEFFTGEIFHSQSFEKRVVMSSTGHKQIRYKVPIILQIKKRRIKTSVNLSDRAHSVFPLLVGRNTLTGKFSVDVQSGSRKLSAAEKRQSKILQSELKEKS